MRLGELQIYVTIQRQQETATGTRGESVHTWVSLYENVPVALDSLQGKELELAHRRYDETTHRLRTRYLPDVKATDRVVELRWGGAFDESFDESFDSPWYQANIYNIGHVDNVNRQFEDMVLLLSRVDE